MKNKRQILIDFCEFMHSGVYDSHNTTHGQDVDAFLESINDAQIESQNVSKNEPTQEFTFNMSCIHCGKNISETNMPYDKCKHVFKGK